MNDAGRDLVGQLPAAALRRYCDPAGFQFASTAELPDPEHVLGQERAIAAIEFGADMGRDGYNLFVLGQTAAGKHNLVQHFLSERAAKEKPPSDWVYVNNFAQPHKPKAIELPTGRGAQFCDAMAMMIDELRTAIPAIFDSEEYRARRNSINEEVGSQQEQAFEDLRKRAEARDIRLIRTPAGIALAPVRNGEVLKPDTFEALPEVTRKGIEQDIQTLQQELQKIMEHMPRLEKERRRALRELNQEFANYAVKESIDEERAAFADLPEVLGYLDAVQADVIDNVHLFIMQSELRESTEFAGVSNETGDGGLVQEGSMPAILGSSFRRYETNLIVDNSGAAGAPVVHEGKPSLAELVGRVEHLAQMGALVTDFTLIKPGALHRANGGYLLLDSRALLMQPFAWDALKRALWNREVRIESASDMYSLASTISLDPEPIPLQTKVVLFGEPMTYYMLSSLDPDFQGLFKAAAEMEDVVDWNAQSETAFARQIAAICRQEEISHLDPTGVAAIMEQAARQADDAEKLSIRIGKISDLLRESDYWARKAGADLIAAAHVEQAVAARHERAGRIREKSQEAILRDIILVDTDGDKVGQINGLSVLSIGDYSFGRPSRISASIGIGAGRVLDIEREVELGGPLHSKGVLILSGFLRERFGGERPLALTASLVFEQSYGGVDGDSASSAELYCLLSALADAPIKQGFAVTGSVNQHGAVQAIGGVNEKIEGFFDICDRRGLTGEQGVLIPVANVKHLMLRHDVVEAVDAGKFHIHAIDTIDRGIEILTGIPAGAPDDEGNYPDDSINGRVARRLDRFITARKRLEAKDGEGGSASNALAGDKLSDGRLNS